MSTGLAQHPARPAPPAEARSRGRRRAVLAVAGLYLLAVVVYSTLALRSPLPLLFPDEFRYSHLARALADGQGFTWRGTDVGQTAALYVYFITPAWAILGSATDAYAASKVLGTLALCAQVVPLWLLGRELLGPRTAVVAAALGVAGTWMVSTAETTTEALALPLTTGALCAAALTLRRPSRRLGLLALGLILLATWARIQLAVLVPALAAILALDLLRVPAGRAQRARAHAPALGAAAVLTAAGAVIALADPGLTGDYAGFFGFRPGLSAIAGKSALQLAELTAQTGFLPVLLAVGAALSPRAWRDPRSGPLLLVFWVTAAATVAQSGFYLAGYPSATWGVQRYVAYAAPLGVLLAVVLISDRRLVTRWTLLAGAALALVLAARPEVRLMGAERATWATGHRLHQLLGVDVPTALVVTALVTVAAAALVRARWGGGARAALAVAAVLAVVLGVQDQAAWHQLTTTSKTFRSVMPDDLSWVDHHVSGPVALLGVTQNAPQFDDLDFFNRRITQVYGPESGLPGRRPQGQVCGFHVDRTTGVLRFGDGCGPPPTRLLINDPSARFTFHGEIRSAREPHVGRVVEVAGAPPRARSLVVLACPRTTPTFYDATPQIRPASAPIGCRPAVTGNLWLHAAADVVARYAGGRRSQAVTVDGRRHVVPAGATRTIRFRAPAGASSFALEQDWTSTDGAPRLVSLELVDAAGRAIALI
ncbi:MAG TPA: hypothetical protein VFT50_07595 [Baekduia sp.]|nr:hypothetical protein [Baekduia sp.]